MKLLKFIPKKSLSYKPVKSYSKYRESNSVFTASNILRDVLIGKKQAVYNQAAWMGRGCFKKIVKNSYIIGKGIGPGPGSEQMRQLLDQIWRNRSKNKLGGCIRIDSNTYYPLLLQYQKEKKHWNVIDPRPEGFSIFGALAREAESGEIYKRIGVDIITPVYLLRNNTLPPWEKIKNKKGLVDFILKKFPLALKEKYNILPGAKIIVLEMVESGYWELDGGVLIRHGKTPYRIVNLHFALIDKDRKTLEYLTKQTRAILKEITPNVKGRKKRELDILLVKKLGETAGKLFTHAVIHGQLHIHYQNISIVGELSDFDSSVFLNNCSDLIKSIPLPKLDNSIATAHSKFAKSISKIETKHNVNLQKFIDLDIHKYNKSKEILAMYMLGQIYDIYNHALKSYDLLGRASKKNFTIDGTILTKKEMDEVKFNFMEAFTVEIAKKQSFNFLSWAIKHGAKPFLNIYLNKKGQTTIYGWHKKNSPLNHLLKKCNSVKNDFIRKDGRAFLKQLAQF